MAKAWSDAIEGLVTNGTLKKDAPAAFGDSFALPTGKQSPTPGVGNVHISADGSRAGAAMTLSASVNAVIMP